MTIFVIKLATFLIVYTVSLNQKKNKNNFNDDKIHQEKKTNLNHQEMLEQFV